MIKIGLAVITHNRLDYLKQCITSLNTHNWGGAVVKFIVDDCSTDGTKEYIKALDISNFRFDKNVGVAVAKNKALQYLAEEMDCDYIFLMEDDILMVDDKTCIKYITYAQQHTLQHLNFGLHGELNKGKSRVNYEGVFVYPDCVGAFSMYTNEVIQIVGYMDEEFVNAWEHVDYTYRIAGMGYTTPFGQFADHPQSNLLLKEIPGSIKNSSITKRQDWQENIIKGQKHWIKKYGRWLW